MSTTLRVCHLSDFHLPLPGPVALHHLFSKRMLGYWNLRMVRSRVHELDVFRRVLREMAAARPDVVLITGDTVNLALPDEFAFVVSELRASGLDGAILPIPGNHDRYTPTAQWGRHFETAYAHWLPDGRDVHYPWIHQAGPVRIAGMCSAQFRGPLRAAGHVSRAQLRALADHVAAAPDAPWIVALHHPPFLLPQGAAAHYLSGLVNYRSFWTALRGATNAVVLHGHTHLSSLRHVEGIPVLGIASASCKAAAPARSAAFHTLEYRDGRLHAVHHTRWDEATGRFVDSALNVRAGAL